MVPIMFLVAGKADFYIDRAASPVKSKIAAMIAEQFVQLQLKPMQKSKKCYISSGITWRADISKC